MDARILVVDDEEDVLAFVVPTLEGAGYEVITACDGDEALIKWRADYPDLIVLDIRMPGLTGYEVLRKIREDDKNVPIVMLTNLDEIFEQKNAIRWGANQFVGKSELELLQHWVQAELKELHDTNLECEDLKINYDSMQVHIRRDGGWRKIKLETLPRKLLFHLARRAGRVQLFDELKVRVFGVSADVEFGGLTTTVSKLRKGIEPVPTKPKHIITVRGAGYRFDL